MPRQNIKEEVAKITKQLSLEDANDIFYRIILEKKIRTGRRRYKARKSLYY